MTTPAPLLSVRDLTVEFRRDRSWLRALHGVSFDVFEGETVGVVGESGSGKSVTVQSLMGLLPARSSRLAAGSAVFAGRDILRLPRRELRRIRGKDIAMVFQDPMSSLNPVFTVGYQIAEAIREHNPGLSRETLRERTLAVLSRVELPHPAQAFSTFPFQFSGGMRQRAMIAMAIANAPRLLIADEPTTALDVTIQAQVMQVLQQARGTGSAMLLITHDMGLVAEATDRVIVMYAGRVIETGTTAEVFAAPRHPYTRGLLASRPKLAAAGGRLTPIPGSPPNIASLPGGKAFHPRCALHERHRDPICVDTVPALLPREGAGLVACHLTHLLGSAQREMETT